MSDAQVGDSFTLDLTGQVGPLVQGTHVEVALLVDAATADLLHGAHVDHSPDERQWVSTALHPPRNINLISLSPRLLLNHPATSLRKYMGESWWNVVSVCMGMYRLRDICELR